MANLLDGFSYTINSKLIGEINIRCCICQDSSICRVEEWITKNRLLFVPFMRRVVGYSFTWIDCRHQLGFDAQEKLNIYRDKLREFRTLPMPNCADLIPVEFEERGILPKDRTARVVAILLTLVFIVLFLLFACSMLRDLLLLLT
jgi:hypothetical protein